jgi:hypothetical protein
MGFKTWVERSTLAFLQWLIMILRKSLYSTDHTSPVAEMTAKCRVLEVSKEWSRYFASWILQGCSAVVETLLRLAGFSWWAIISALITSFFLFAILLEVIATTIEAFDISRNRPFLTST